MSEETITPPPEAWVVFGELFTFWEHAQATRDEAIDKFVKAEFDIFKSFPTWAELEVDGYICVKYVLAPTEDTP